jgi:hypothetical protein
MIQRTQILLKGFLLCFAFISCEKLLLRPELNDDAEVVFEYLWKDIQSRYSFFEEKNIDWDEIKSIYQPQVSNGMNALDFFDLLADMMFELQDGHVNITTGFDRSRNWEWFQNFPENYNQTIVERNYLKTDFRVTGALLNQIVDSVLYVNYRSFSSPISDGHLGFILSRAAGLKGIIIDVRNNGGGSLGNAYRLASCFVDHPYIFARERLKNGPGKDDFTNWQSMQISPREEGVYGGKVVVLINRKSYSATTFFAQMMKMAPNAILMGDKTGGGGGIPAFGELPNGWRYRFSASQTVDLNDYQIEFGVEPDVEVAMSSADELNGKDSIIEAALEWLNQ